MLVCEFHFALVGFHCGPVARPYGLTDERFAFVAEYRVGTVGVLWLPEDRSPEFTHVQPSGNVVRCSMFHRWKKTSFALVAAKPLFLAIAVIRTQVDVKDGYFRAIYWSCGHRLPVVVF